MEHRIASPSRTYSNMPETNRGVAKKMKRPYSRVLVTTVGEQQNEVQGKRKELLDQPASNQVRPAEQAAVVTPFNASATQAAAQATSVNTSRSDNPMPGSSRGTVSRTSRITVARGCSTTQDDAQPSTSRQILTESGLEVLDSMTFKRDIDGEGVEIIVVKDSESSSDSSDDSFTRRHFFQESRVPYTVAEDEEILRYVLSGNNIERTGSIILWRELEILKDNPKRTYQSLKNRFLRNIKPLIFTRFRHMLTTEAIRMLHKKFPELGRRKSSSPVNKKSPQKTQPKRVICVNPSMEGRPTPFYTDRHFGIINVTDRSLLEDDEVPAEPSPRPPPTPPVDREFRDAAVGADIPTGQVPNEVSGDGTMRQGGLWADPTLPTDRLDRLVKIFAKEKLRNVPVQTFKYYETINSFSNRAALNLRLLLDRSCEEPLPPQLPINVSVTVTVGKEEHNQAKKAQKLAAKRKNNLRAKREKKKKKEAEKAKKKGSVRGYVLKVKDKYSNKSRKNTENTENTEWYIKTAESVKYNIEVERLLSRLKGNEPTTSAMSCESQSDIEVSASANREEEGQSQSTNFSSEDDSFYTQALRNVGHNYKVDVKQTQNLTEEQLEENMDESSVPAPQPVENSLPVNKRTAAGRVNSFGGKAPTSSYNLRKLKNV